MYGRAVSRGFDPMRCAAMLPARHYQSVTLMFEGYRSSMVLYVRSAVLRQASMRANARVMPLKGTLLWSSCFQKARMANSAALCARRTCLHGK